ncbi:hypothetical protein R3P38DRAFT_3565622 [Favolaschia claudopus]|uniref:DUF6534 domain-containing protein n=1 Tax=Favolaschia claudopus TaxID=2862362 RepID=A0AAW0DWQ6_9AGAR
MSAHSTEVQTLDNTLGAVFIGVVVSCILFGVSALQVYLYYHYYPNDSRLHKLSVAVLWVLDALHLSLTIFATYHYGTQLILPGAVTYSSFFAVRPIKLLVAINVVIILLVQSLYTYRVWLLSGYHHGVLGYLVTGVVLGGFAIGIVLSFETYTINSWGEVSDIAWAIESSFAASTTIDVVISIAMCFYLRKSKGPGSRLNSRIATLMQYTLSCGVFTSACSIACLFTFILMPNNLVFLALTYLLTRLYINSFMAMMNARERVHRPNESTSLVLSTQSMSASRPPFPRDPEAVGRLTILSLPVNFLSNMSSTNLKQQRSPLDQENKYDWVDLPHGIPVLESQPRHGDSYGMTPSHPQKQQIHDHAYAHRW